MASRSPKSNNLERRIIALSGVMILLSFFLLAQATGKLAGSLFAKEAQKAEKESFYEFSNLFAEVYQDIKDKYVEEVDDRKLFEAAIDGMFRALDPHSQFLDPDSLSMLEKDTEGEFSGIGIHIVMDESGALAVIAPMPGTPAAEAGLLPWDRIVEIEGESTEGIDIVAAVKKLTGPEGSKVTITVFREGEPELLYFTITRRHIKVDSVYTRIAEGGIMLMRLARFSEETSADLRRALEDAKSKGVRGLIIDLRNNTGGLLKEAINVSDLFLHKGQVIVSTKGRLESQNREYTAANEPIGSWPMLILINRGSASASEIFAGAMRDHGRARLVGPKGERTFGKGSVQTIDPLEHSLERDERGNLLPAALRLTTARYYTPNGTAIDNKDPEKRGLAPDLEVELTREHQFELTRRGMLLGEVNLVEPGKAKNGDAGNENGAEPKEDAEKEEPFVDLQLQFAIDEMKRMLDSGANATADVAKAAPAETEPLPVAAAN